MRSSNSTFRKRAPKAIKVIREFAAKTMKTSDVRIDADLNKSIWKRGIKSVEHRVRIRVERRRNDDQDAKEKFYSYVSFVPVTTFKGLQNVTVEQE